MLSTLVDAKKKKKRLPAGGKYQIHEGKVSRAAALKSRIVWLSYCIALEPEMPACEMEGLWASKIASRMAGELKEGWELKGS